MGVLCSTPGSFSAVRPDMCVPNTGTKQVPIMGTLPNAHIILWVPILGSVLLTAKLLLTTM